MVLPGLFDAAQVAKADIFDDVWATRHHDERGIVADAYALPVPRRYFRDVPDSARDQPYKLNDLYLVDDDVRSIILAEPLVAMLRQLAGDEIVAFNSLHLERGSAQDYHLDTFYMPPPPGGRLIVSSICLEDVHPDAGPLGYYAGSHLIEPFLNCDGDRRARTMQEHTDAFGHIYGEIERRQLSPTIFCGKAGDTFIWHEQLLHSGTPIVDMQRTRKTIVTHYCTKSSMTGVDLVQHGSGWYVRRPAPAVDAD